MAFLGRGRLFQKPQQGSDSDDDYGTRVLEAKPIAQRIADRLDGSYQPKSFVTASDKSQQEFYGHQKVINQMPSSSRDSTDAGSTLSTEEKNKLNAKIMKAEMRGNKELAKKLRKQLEADGTDAPTKKSKRKERREADKRRKKRSDSDSEDDKNSRQDILLTTTDGRTGLTRPLDQRRRDTVDQSIRDMLEEERRTTADDQLAALCDIANKKIAKTRLDAREDETIDDVVISSKAEKKSKKRKREKEEKDERLKRKHAIDEYKKEQRTLDTCAWCFDSDAAHKYLIVAVGIKTYLAVPEKVPIVDGHLVVVPMQHSASSVQMDEDVYAEMQLWRKGLVAMYQ